MIHILSLSIANTGDVCNWPIWNDCNVKLDVGGLSHIRKLVLIGRASKSPALFSLHQHRPLLHPSILEFTPTLTMNGINGLNGHAALPDLWQEARNSDGRVYYFNTITKATQWTKPEDLMTPAEVSAHALLSTYGY
jgi:hypothetical protein